MTARTPVRGRTDRCRPGAADVRPEVGQQEDSKSDSKIINIIVINIIIIITIRSRTARARTARTPCDW